MTGQVPIISGQILFPEGASVGGKPDHLASLKSGQKSFLLQNFNIVECLENLPVF